MNRLISCASAALIDAVARDHYGIPESVLMEDAAYGMLNRLLEEWGGVVPEGNFVFLAGNGNNGGDALALMRLFALSGKEELCALLAGDPKGLCLTHAGIASRMGIEILSLPANPERAAKLIDSAACLFDGVSGTGLNGPLGGNASKLLEAAKKTKAFRIALDLPSGLGDSWAGGNPVFTSDLTLSIGELKKCLYYPSARGACGKILRINGVFPRKALESVQAAAELVEDSDLEEYLPRLGADSYKGDRGHAAVFAGARGTTGAAFLCAVAAARAGAGLVSLFAEKDIYEILAGKLASVMAKPIPENPIEVASILERCDAVLAGPGWGRGKGRAELLGAILDSGLPTVLDADGIRLFAEIPPGRNGGTGIKLILTPHPGEFRALAGGNAPDFLDLPEEPILSAAKRFGAVIVLKSHVTWIASPEGRLAVYDGMLAALGTGGSGDVLSGIISGLLALGSEPFEAAVAGVILHGRAGRSCFAGKGAFLAEDLLPEISKIAGGIFGEGNHAET